MMVFTPSPSKPSQSPSQQPPESQSPTTLRLAALREVLDNIIDLEGVDFTDRFSYQYQALDWLANEDSFFHSFDSLDDKDVEILVARYALTAVYFAGKITFYFPDWSMGTSHCDWRGIGCSNNYTTVSMNFCKKRKIQRYLCHIGSKNLQLTGVFCHFLYSNCIKLHEIPNT